MENLIEKYAELLYKLQEYQNYLSTGDLEVALSNYTLELMSSNGIDFRPIMFKRDWTTECLWYLGDKAQLDFHNNGWIMYRFGDNLEKLGQIPPKSGKYLVYRGDKTHFENYNGTGFAYNDKTITHWKEILKPK